MPANDNRHAKPWQWTALLRSRCLHFCLSQIALCLLLLAIWPHFEIDDGYIFLAYAKHLAASGLFAFNPGEVSYGFSSPAYVMLLALVAKLSGIPVGVALSNVLGVIMCGLSSLAVWMVWSEIQDRPTDRELLLMSILFSGPWFFTVWFVFGMETGLSLLSLLGFLLWLLKVRSGARSWPWLFLGAVAAILLATTRLESAIYIASGILLALATSKSKRAVRDLLLVAALSGGAELAWLLYARHTFGSYMPWTSTGRLLYYIPGSLGLTSGTQYYQLAFFGRSSVALKALWEMIFGGPIKFMLLFIPLSAAIFFLRNNSENSAVSKRVLRTAMFGIAAELILFAYFFPLAKNRHLAPYIIGIWVLVVPAVARAVSRMPKIFQVGAFLVVVGLWAGGAVQYRREGKLITSLFQVAASPTLLPTDRVAAEPIGVLAYYSPAYIVDMGGLVDRGPWPLLMSGEHANPQKYIEWALSKGSTKLLLSANVCSQQGERIGPWCILNAAQARSYAESLSHPKGQ